MTADGLLECARCGRFTRTLDDGGRCRDCRVGWRHCPDHGLEWDDGSHRRVTVREVLVAVPDVARSGGAR